MLQIVFLSQDRFSGNCCLLVDYNVLRGRIWVLVLATVLLGQIIVGTLVSR